MTVFSEVMKGPFDRCAGERGATPRENAWTLAGFDGERLISVPGDGEIFLGRLDGRPLFLNEETTFDFRAAAAVLPTDEIALLAYAQGMLHWTQRARFCPACGTALEVRQSGHARACPDCGIEVYPRTDPVVMMLVTNRGRLLLAQHRGRGSAFWSTLAGFVEPGETLEAAVRRELAEETGLTAGEIRYFGSQSWPLPASLMIGFTIETVGDGITIDETELLKARWFAHEELDHVTLSNPISLSRQMIESWRGLRVSALD